MKKQMQLVRCTVNGREVEEYVDVRESLLDMLRNRLGLTSVKKGCEVGECGACTVIIDGETIDSCIIWQSGRRVKISVHWKVWRKTENLPGFRRHLSKKVPYSAVSALPDLSCLPLFYWNVERNYQEMRFGNIWQEISAAAQVMRTL